MKKSKELSRVIETSMGKYLYRSFRPPIPLRTSPRKEKFKVKKDLKRLNENILSSTLINDEEQQMKKKKKKLQRIKKQLSFHSNEENEKKSLLFIISSDEENSIDEDLFNEQKSTLCFINSTTRRGLIFSPRSSQFTFQGVFSIEQLSGSSATIHGYQIQLFNRYTIYNLPHQSFIPIETGSAQSKTILTDHQILSLFAQYQIDVKQAEIYFPLIRKASKIHHGLAIFLIEEHRSTWLESIKQYSIHLDSSTSSSEQQQNDETTNTSATSNSNTHFQHCWNGMDAFQDPQSHSISYSDEIRSTTDEILSRRENPKPLIIFVCGAKDSGKSTYLRYAINRCLNDSNNPMKISFLDCDIGQSEFTPSGTISYFDQINEPLFGPSASHLKKPTKSFYFGNIQVLPDQTTKYLNYVKSMVEAIRREPFGVLFVNTMGWGSDDGLIIMKELIDLIRPDIVVQLRSSNPHFRHIMPDLNPQWSINAPISSTFRQMHHLGEQSLHDHYEYHLFSTPVRQQNVQGKSSRTRQMCLWAYFSQMERKDPMIKPLIDYSNRLEIFSFQQISIGILHRQIQAKYLLQVLNGSVVSLCRIRQEMLYRPSTQYPALIDERASLECLGFGFVRSIDMTRGEIHLIIPDGKISKSQINGLVKGQDDCPEEFYFMSIDRWRGTMPPYVSGSIS